MENVKDFFNKLKDSMDKNPIIKRMAIIMGIFILLIILLIIISSCARRNAKPKTYSYKDFEKYMITLTKNRYKDKEDQLPKNDKDVVSVELQSFINDGTIEDLTEIIENNSTCKGTVKIINNYGHLLYLPNLDCGKDYKTKTIYDTLTTEENIVTEGSGLYKVDDEYIFRGEAVNNYLKLNNITFRIIKVYDDGDIRIIDTTGKYPNSSWDDRYNVDKSGNVGINEYIQENKINSRLKDSIEDIYNNYELFTDDIKSYFVSKEICVGKRSINDDIFDKSIECSKTIDAYPFGLIYPYEYYIASLDQNCHSIKDESCKNYNYFSNFLKMTWTTIGDKDISYQAFRISSVGASTHKTSYATPIRIVTNINKDLIVKSGTGTEEDPYIIETFTNEKSTKKK